MRCAFRGPAVLLVFAMVQLAPAMAVAQNKLVVTEVTPLQLELHPIKSAVSYKPIEIPPLKLVEIPVLKRVEPVLLNFPRLVPASLPPQPKIVPMIAIERLITANTLLPIEPVYKEPEIHIFQGKKPTIPEGTFYQGTHPFNNINWPASSIPGGLTLSSGTLSTELLHVDPYNSLVLDSSGALVILAPEKRSIDVAPLSNPIPEPCSFVIFLVAGSLCLTMSRRSIRCVERI